MTCFAIGAASVPPWPPWERSIVTATAIFGDAAGAKPMNQGWLTSWSRDDLRGAGLAGHVDALQRRRGAGALADDVLHHPRELGGRPLVHDPALALGLDAVGDAPVGDRRRTA